MGCGRRGLRGGIFGAWLCEIGWVGSVLDGYIFVAEKDQ